MFKNKQKSTFQDYEDRKNPIIVKKFGGTSVAGIDNIKNVARHVERAIEKGEHVVIVVSAMAGVTNELTSKCLAISNLSNNNCLREYDAAISSGEIITSALLALELIELGLDARSFQGWQVPIITNRRFSDALVKHIDPSKIYDLLEQGIIPIITGFQGVTDRGEVSTLGKGGSDTTASLIAAALKADRCDIYTDVSGVYSADPRIIKNAKQIPSLSFREMLALSRLGAKVLHPRSVLACFRYDIDMRVVSSFYQEESQKIGTDIIQVHPNIESEICINKLSDINFKTDKATEVNYSGDKIMEDAEVKAITSNRNILNIVVKISFKQNSRQNPVGNQIEAISLMISEISKANLLFSSYSSVLLNDNSAEVSFIVSMIDQNRYDSFFLSLQKNHLIDSYRFISNIATVSLIGYGVNNNKIIARSIQIMASESIMVYNLSTSDVDLTFTINDSNTDKAIKSLHSLVCKK